MRKLATIEVVNRVEKHDNADTLEIYGIKGWNVIGLIDQYKVGDLVIYCEVDSWIPHELAPFLSKGKEPREYGGVLGERLSTAKLRGRLSQGLLLSTDLLPEGTELVEGLDVTELLSIQKWDRPIPTEMRGISKGGFPSFIIRPSMNRIQNIHPNTLKELSKKETVFQISEKLDGSSMHVYYNEGVWGVCSANTDLILEQEGNVFVRMFNKIKPQLEKFSEILLTEAGIGNFSIGGELIGVGIQGNPYKLTENKYMVYNGFDISGAVPLLPNDVYEWATKAGLDVVPIMDEGLLDGTIVEILESADGMSVLNNKTRREGLVYKSAVRGNGNYRGDYFTMKVISNKWLLKN